MKILFLGCLFDEKEENDLLKESKIGLPGAVNTYQWNLIKGLDKVLKTPVDIVNVLPVGTYPKYFKNLILKTKRWSHSLGAKDLEIGSINVPLLKQAWRAISCKKAIRKWLKSAENEKGILIYSTYLPFLYSVKNLPDTVKITLIVTDLPEYYDLTASRNQIKKCLRVVYNRFVL